MYILDAEQGRSSEACSPTAECFYLPIRPRAAVVSLIEQMLRVELSEVLVYLLEKVHGNAGIPDA